MGYTPDPLAHAECLEFIRAAISKNCPKTALDVASVVKEVCDSGHANREQIWQDLEPQEQACFRELLESARPEVRS